MIEKMQNSLVITVKEQTFTTCTNFKFYIKQKEIIEIVPSVLNDTQVYVLLSYTTALKLTKGECSVQLLWTDANGVPRGTKKHYVEVEEIIPKDGYNG